METTLQRSHEPHLSPVYAQRSRTQTLLLAMALASLAVAGIVMPLVWDILGAINRLPKMGLLQSALNTAPWLSWLLMLFWGSTVPLAIIYALYHPRGVRSVLLVAALMLVAVTWYVHMPSASQCEALYGGLSASNTACRLLQWVFSLSLGMATAAYVFMVFVLCLSALGLAFEKSDDPWQDPRKTRPQDVCSDLLHPHSVHAQTQCTPLN